MVASRTATASALPSSLSQPTLPNVFLMGLIEFDHKVCPEILAISCSEGADLEC